MKIWAWDNETKQWFTEHRDIHLSAREIHQNSFYRNWPARYKAVIGEATAQRIQLWTGQRPMTTNPTARDFYVWLLLWGPGAYAVAERMTSPAERDWHPAFARDVVLKIGRVWDVGMKDVPEDLDETG